MIRLLLFVLGLGSGTASLRYPRHRPTYVRPGTTPVSYHTHLDNTDAFRANKVAINYRTRLDAWSHPHHKVAASEDDAAGNAPVHNESTHHAPGGWSRESAATDAVDASESSSRRRLAPDDWMTWEEAAAVDAIGPLRTSFVTEFIAQGAATQHCSIAGQVVDPGLMTAAFGASSPLTCTEQDVAGVAKIASAQVRLDWTKQCVVFATLTVHDPPPPLPTHTHTRHHATRTPARTPVKACVHKKRRGCLMRLLGRVEACACSARGKAWWLLLGVVVVACGVTAPSSRQPRKRLAYVVCGITIHHHHHQCAARARVCFFFLFADVVPATGTCETLSA